MLAVLDNLGAIALVEKPSVTTSFTDMYGLAT
jgi:hypothetical protein